MYPVVDTAVDLCLCLFSPVKHYTSNQSSSNVWTWKQHWYSVVVFFVWFSCRGCCLSG